MERLHHPNILTVYDHGEDHARRYLVFELAEGRSLATVLKEERLSAPMALDIAHQILAALAYAHEQGVVHAALAPRHVLLSKGGTVKVRNFWKVRRPGAVPEPEIAYLAPEVFAEGRTDVQTDVYGVRALLYRMLAGVPPFRGPAFILPRRIRDDVPPPPSSAGDDVPPEFDAVVLKALAKRLEERFPSTPALDEALRAAMTTVGEPRPRAVSARGLQRRQLAVGEVVFQEGDIADCAYIVESGSIRITKRGADRAPVVLATLGRGEIFGEMALVDDQPRMAGAVAAQPTTVAVIPRDAFQARIGRLDKVTHKLLTVLVERVRSVAKDLTELRGMVE